MACCGSRRAQAGTPGRGRDEGRNVNAPATPEAPARPAQATSGPSVPLRYLRRDPLALRGPRTGRIYHVSGASAVVAAHPDDAPALLRTGLFAEGAG